MVTWLLKYLVAIFLMIFQCLIMTMAQAFKGTYYHNKLYCFALIFHRKLSNWELLFKFFRTRDVPITREMANDTIHCKDGAAATLLENAYSFLTNKKWYQFYWLNVTEFYFKQ